MNDSMSVDSATFRSAVPAKKQKGRILAATLSLPGLAVLAGLAGNQAHAEGVPEQTTLAVRYGYYADRQPGLERVHVKAPQVYLQAPLGSDWAVEGSAVVDQVSGASPRWHSEISSASRMSDLRKAGDVKLTRYFSRASLAVSAAYSDEHDYTSRALGIEARISSDDNNRSWIFGLGGSRDRIDNTSNGVNTAVDQRKRTEEAMVGLTQVLTPTDLLQVNLTRSVGRGYYNDPYKQFDQRPSSRDAWIGLVRWNHYLERSDAALRTSYRYYSDTFGIRAHTLGVEWAQPTGKWMLTPGLRYYTQSAADFFVNPVLDAQGRYDNIATISRLSSIAGNKSADQRLGAFGAFTLSLKANYALSAQTSLDFKIERYRQSASWRLGGKGTPSIAPFDAVFLQAGFTHRF